MPQVLHEDVALARAVIHRGDLVVLLGEFPLQHRDALFKDRHESRGITASDSPTPLSTLGSSRLVRLEELAAQQLFADPP